MRGELLQSHLHVKLCYKACHTKIIAECEGAERSKGTDKPLVEFGREGHFFG